MNPKPTGPNVPHLTLADVYYILFRHKWKILILAAAGIAAAMVVPRFSPKIYQSEAKLLIRYILDSHAPSQPGQSDSRMKSLDDGAANIINTEIEILTSLDLAQEVATNIGPDKILGTKSGGDINAAASVIHGGLTVDDPNKGDVIRLVFRHSDYELVQPILHEIIRTYLERHADIHHSAGAYDDFLTHETDELRTRLKNTEDALRAAKTNLNIASIEDSRKIFGDHMARIQQDIFSAEAELAEREGTVGELYKLGATNVTGTNTLAGTNSPAGTNAQIAATPVTNSPSVPSEKEAAYEEVTDMLDRFHKKEKDLLSSGYLPESTVVKDIRDQIAVFEKNKKKLEQENPGLLVKNGPSSNDATNQMYQLSLIAERTRIAALDSKIDELNKQLAFIKDRSAAVDSSEASITDLQRTKELEESNYKYFMQSLESSRIDNELGPGKASNIKPVQNPSPPFRDTSKLRKVRMMLSAGGVAAGIALAFLIELYLDRSLKRPVEIEPRLGLPLLLSIPYRNGKSHKRLLGAPPGTGLAVKSEQTGRSVPLLGGRVTFGRGDDNTMSFPEGSISLHHCEILVRDGQALIRDLGSSNGTFVDGERVTERLLEAGQSLSLGEKIELEVVEDAVARSQEVAAIPTTWNPSHALRPFYDALRDRLITYFEVRNLTHKPKLVAVTSCSRGAGVSSTATGLAAALSETGEGNVLLVDMNEQNGGATHYFRKGRLAFGLDDALQKEKRHGALVQNNLYVVSEGSNGDMLPALMPKRFTEIVPKLKASDYDYIIFDMPAVSQISVTPRLARFMDMMLIVVESEKTDRDVVQRAATMLTEARGHVGVVLNKWKNYVPGSIQQEL